MPPVVVAKRLDAALKDRLRAALAEMHLDPLAAQGLQQGLIRRLAPVTDEHYNDIRHMLAAVQAVTFPFV
jgi:ABC-type phosphate/phosphonate transport system substrate-binding protein